MGNEKIKNVKKALEFCTSLKKRCRDCDYNEIGCYKLLKDVLTYINELESENKSLQDLCNKTYEDLTKEIDRLEEINKKLKQSNKNILFVNEQVIEKNKQLENRVKELEEGIAKSMLGCEFLPECTKEIAEKIWNMSKHIVDDTKYIVQGREYLHLDTLKEIIKFCGVEIKE